MKAERTDERARDTYTYRILINAAQRNAPLWQLLLILFVNFEICFSSFSAAPRYLFSSLRELVLLPRHRTQKIIQSAQTRVYNVARPVRPAREARYARRRTLTKNCCCRWPCCANVKYGNGTSAELTSRNLLDHPVGPRSRAHAPFIIHSKYCLCIHTPARVTACRRRTKKEREREREKKREKKPRRDYVFA